MVPRDAAEWPQNCGGGREALCAVVREVAIDREVMATLANGAVVQQVAVLHASVAKSGIKNFLVIALDERMKRFCVEQGIPYFFSPNTAQGNHKVSAEKFGIIKNFIAVGCSVLLTDTDVVYMQDPFRALYRDSDIESMSDGWDNHTAFGFMDNVRNARGEGEEAVLHSLRNMALNSGLWFVAATHAVMRFLVLVEHEVTTKDIWDQTAYNLILRRFSYGTLKGPGCTIRVLNPLCFMNTKVATRYLYTSEHLRRHTPVAVHVNYHPDKENKVHLLQQYYFEGKAELRDLGVKLGGLADREPLVPAEALVNPRVENAHLFSLNEQLAPLEEVQQHQCRPGPPVENVGHELNFLRPGEAEAWPAEAGCADVPGLCAFVRDVLQAREFLVVFVTAATVDWVEPMLESVRKAGVKATALVSLDEVAAEHFDGLGNHLDYRGRSKFEVVKQLLALDCRVLAADPDVLFYGDPFAALYRDSDLEALSDGWDLHSIAGHDSVVDDPHMGWSRFCHGVRAMALNPGLFYVQPTEDAVRFLENVLERRGNGVDEHAAFNAELWQMSRDGYLASGITVRAMHHFCFAKSSFILQRVASRPDLRAAVRPVAVKVSHVGSDAKRQALKDLAAAGADAKAIVSARGGGAAGITASCGSPRTFDAGLQPALVGHLGAHPKWSWGGGPVEFQAGGKMVTPWGEGHWGPVAAEGGAMAMFADFVGARHHLTFEPDFGTFQSHRCNDFDFIIGTPMP